MKTVHYYASHDFQCFDEPLQAHEAERHTTFNVAPDMLFEIVKSFDFGMGPWLVILPLSAYWQIVLNLDPARLKLFELHCFSAPSTQPLAELHLICPKIMATLHYRNVTILSQP